ncbi:MAG: MBL fold metallo-hydrolase [Burkholderiaceae bacterium]
MQIEGFFDPATWTISYLVVDPDTKVAAIIDSVMDYEASSGRTKTDSAEKLIQRVRELGASIDWILETHAHADHLSAAPHLKEHLGGQIGIGVRIKEVQKVFGSLFNAGKQFAHDGRQFDQLFLDGQELSIGKLKLTVMHTPGHTPACVTYVVTDGKSTAAFVGDTLFMPDYGTARCDFPGGDPKTLYQSISRVLSLPPDTRLFMCHDYQPGRREVQFESTVAQERAENVHVRDGISIEEFVAMRSARDETLSMPTLLLPSVQINMRAGQLPEPEDNGVAYLKIPLNAL